MKKLIPRSIKNIYHLFRSVWAATIFGFPARKIKTIGITGTNGKTTTVQMTAKILEEAGHQVALASTINFQVGKKHWVNRTKFTTLSAWQVNRLLKEAVMAGCDYAVLEVSSHALDQHRLWGVNFDVVAITNVTREHLDYHRTMGEYRKAKLRLFDKIKKGGTGVVNLEMEKPEEYLGVIEGEKWGCVASEIGKSRFDIGEKLKIKNSKLKILQAEKIEVNAEGSYFCLKGVDFKLNLPGLINIENALVAVSVAVSQGIELEVASRALEKIKRVPGRMDEVENDRGIKIIIDYALTPDSMEKLGELVLGFKKSVNWPISKPDNRIIWVFGSCGERDRGKRPLMGKIVSHYADFAIVTNEDPYGENPSRIINEVFSGLVDRKVEGEFPDYQLSIISDQSDSKKWKMNEGLNAWRIMDRREAIKKALSLAQEGDVILITGKGAEETMAIGEKRIAWNDRKVVEEILNTKS